MKRGWLYLVLLWLPGVAEAAELSTRLALGGGLELDSDTRQGLFELALRADLLFPRSDSIHWGVGPTLQLRTVNFFSLEGSGGLSLLLPLGRASVFTLGGGVGYALRRGNLDYALAFGQLSLGWRLPVGSGAAVQWSPGWGMYLGVQQSITGPPRTQVTVGVEVGLALLWTAMGVLTAP